MTSWIALSTVVANVVVVLLLAAAVAMPGASQLGRLIVATFAFVCAWLANAALDATRPPNWTIFIGATVIVASIVVVLATLHRWTQAADGGETRPARRGDEGEGGPRRHRPDPPWLGGGGSDPSWWPEFERRLAQYVAERQREKLVD